jgi:uncharacterized protein (DUF983 family)
MFKKGTKLYSIFTWKCPRCQEGNFFKNSFTLYPSKITKIYSNCPNCNLKYMLEPSFYFGAMYINYGITVAISIIAFLISKLVFNLSLLQSFAIIFTTLFVLAPLNLRMSRIIWINMFVSFDDKKTKKIS